MTCLLGFPSEGMGAWSFCGRFEHTFGFLHRYGGFGVSGILVLLLVICLYGIEFVHFTEVVELVDIRGYFPGNVCRDASLVEQYFVFSLFFLSMMTRRGWCSALG